MTNRTYIISTAEEDGDPLDITGLVNAFLSYGIANGYINFDVKPVTTNTRYDGTGRPTKQIYYVVQINYYDPSIMD